MSNDPYEQFEATFDHERTSKRSFRKSILATTIVLVVRQGFFEQMTAPD